MGGSGSITDDISYLIDTSCEDTGDGNRVNVIGEVEVSHLVGPSGVEKSDIEPPWLTVEASGDAEDLSALMEYVGVEELEE